MVRWTLSKPDFNLLVTLMCCSRKVVLHAPPGGYGFQGPVSAMSRALARLRETTGDPLLVRAGRGLVSTPRALELRERVSQLVQDAEVVLRPAESSTSNNSSEHLLCGPAKVLWRTSGQSSLLVPPRKHPAYGCASYRSQTKRARHFATELSIWKRVLLRTRRPRSCVYKLCSETVSSLLCESDIRCARAKSRLPVMRLAGTSASRDRGRTSDPIDDALKSFGLERKVAVVLAGGFSTALALARASDLVASVPERHTGNLRAGMHSFPLPVSTPEFYNFIALAPADGFRSSASLAARVRSERMRGTTHGFIDRQTIRRRVK